MREVIVCSGVTTLGVYAGGKSHELNSQAYTGYVRRLSELKSRHEWKTSGQGARFMGMQNPHEDGGARFRISGVTASGGRVIYSAMMDNNSALYYKNLNDDAEREDLIYSDRDIAISGIDCQNSKLLASVRLGGIEAHVALFDLGSAGYRFLTEGDTVDSNPSWSRRYGGALLYDSKGIGRDQDGNIGGFSPRYACRLDLERGEIDELLASPDYEYIKPKEDEKGDLYYLRIPYKARTRRGVGSVLKDIAFAPFKLVMGIVGFLNVFTQRYAGQSLKTGGANPARSKEKSAKEMLIEENLVNVEQALRENSAAGETYPGIAPRGWELRRRDASGNDVCLKKGVLDYCLAADGALVYSNGQYIVRLSPQGGETLVAKAELATNVHAIME